MSNPVDLDISLWLVGVEENLLGRVLTDGDGGPPRTCPCLKVNSERVSRRSAHFTQLVITKRFGSDETPLLVPLTLA